jgi:hypothetical protein
MYLFQFSLYLKYKLQDTLFTDQNKVEDTALANVLFVLESSFLLLFDWSDGISDKANKKIHICFGTRVCRIFQTKLVRRHKLFCCFCQFYLPIENLNAPLVCFSFMHSSMGK